MVKDNEEDTELQQEEYQYADPDSAETFVEPEQPESPPPIARMEDDRRKRIVMVLVVLALVFIVFQFVKAKNKTNKAAEPAPASNIEKQMVAQPQPANMPGTPAAVVVVQPAMNVPGVPAAEQPAPVVTDEMSKLTDQSQQNATQIQQLQTSMQQLQTSVNQLTESVNDLQSKMQGFTKKGWGSMQQKTRRSHRERGYKMGMRSRSNVYFIKAVVPRRAWLQSRGGDEITVKEGDNIQGYGVVQSIDPNDGKVVTSSNKIIRFSADDS